MLLELRFSIWTLGLGSGTFIAALYGMNLKNFIEETDIGFWGISGISAVVSVVVLVYGLQRLRRVQRVSMWGHGDACLPRDWTGMLAIRDAGWQQARAELRTEEKRGLWGLGLGGFMTKPRPKNEQEKMREQRMLAQAKLREQKFQAQEKLREQRLHEVEMREQRLAELEKLQNK
jgi:hypothetical protein